MKLKTLVSKHFVAKSLQPNLKLSSYECKYCPKIYAQHTTRMCEHLLNSKGCPEAVKLSLRQLLGDKPQNVRKRKRKSISKSKNLSDLSSDGNSGNFTNKAEDSINLPTQASNSDAENHPNKQKNRC